MKNGGEGARLPGALTRSYTRCGNPRCHCASDHGHGAWTLTFMVKGKRHVERIPREWVDDVRRRVEAGREFQDAVREVLAANAQLLVLARQQRKRKGAVKGPSPRALWKYATRRLRLAAYFRAPEDGRSRPQIPARTLLWSILVGTILREGTFRAIEALVGSPARRAADWSCLWRRCVTLLYRAPKFGSHPESFGLGAPARQAQ
jgi:hypothetical protein